MTDSSSFSSILSKYRPVSAQPAANAPAAPVISAGTPPTSRPPATALKTGSAPPLNRARPNVMPSTTPSSGNPQTAKPTASMNGSSRSLEPEGPNGQAPKRRKLDAPAKTGPLTAAEKDMEERRKALMEKVKAKKEAAVPKPTSYKEMLAKAAQIQAEKKNMVGVITHKARPPQELKKLKPDLKPAKGTGAQSNRNSKSPGVTTAGDKVPKKGTDAAKNGAGKRVVDGARSIASKDSNVERKKSIDSQVLKRKRDLPLSKAPSRKSAYQDRRRSRYDDEEDDDWIVDDEDDDPRGGGYGGYGRSRYRYAEDYDDDDESDMEATGMDLLEEEERSRRAAIKEDQLEAKRLEEEAKRKAALKKAAMKKNK